MNLKTKIKNNFPGIAYVIPFIKQYKFRELSKPSFIKNSLKKYLKIKAYKGKNGSTGDAWERLFKNINISKDSKSNFLYFIDENKTLALKGQTLSNFCIDYERVLEKGFNEIVKDAMGDDEYGYEAKNVGNSVNILCSRIVKYLETSNISDKEKLINYFSNLLVQKAENFEEALQRILFFNQILWQTKHRLNGLGRLDKILEPYYSQDIKKDILTKDKARHLISDFLNQLTRFYNFKSDTLIGDIGQIIILGGKDNEEKYFYNDLTFMFLEEQSKLKKPDPKILLRVSSLMPRELLETAIKCLLANTGSPLFSNDDVVVPSLIDGGIEKNDAYNYCTSACWEPFIAGKSLDQNNIMCFDFFKAFDEVSSQDAKNFNEFLDKYIDNNKILFNKLLEELNDLYWAKDPFVSLLTDCCNNNRRDISLGGSKYKNFGITTVALPNVIDSLMFVKKFVFDEQKFTLQQLNTARLKNFCDDPNLLRLVKKNSGKFGSDEKVQIALTNIITKSLSGFCENSKNKYGGNVKFGLSSPSYIIESKKSNGDFSGRLRGEPYQTHISSDKAAPTEVINFANKLEYSNFRYNGNVVDIVLTPHVLENNMNKFVLFIENAIKNGVFQMQFNIFDSKTLIDAKKHPEKYPNLIVRVWGFSSYFNDLPDSYKDLMIKRAIENESTAA